MWSPTHIQVTVQRAKGLLAKGKNGTNNCFVTIGLGKEKFQTSVKDKSMESVEWHEECELTIPDKGNRAELSLTVLHRNNLSIDEFLGQVTLPLNEMDVYERPRSKWFKLESKPGKEKKNKERGELEVRVGFIVKSGSLSDLSKKEKHKSSIGQLASSVGGSLLSIGQIEKRKGLKKFAKSLGSKMHINSKSKHKDDKESSINGSFTSLDTPSSSRGNSRRYGQKAGEADPGVISEDEDEFAFDNLSHKSSGSSLNIRGVHHRTLHTPSPLMLTQDETNLRSKTLPPPSKPPRIPTDQKLGEWEAKLYGSGGLSSSVTKHLDVGSSDSLKRRSWEVSRVPLPPPTEEDNFKEIALIEEPIISNTAPSTPILKKSMDNLAFDNDTNTPLEQPKAMPRSSTLENLSPDKILSEPKEKTETKKQRFASKLKYFKREKSDLFDDSKNERIIIGNEDTFKKQLDMRRNEISPHLLKKYEGKSKEDLMVLANGFENEIILQRQKVKELEDYLDDLLLRVMETHPRILQNPYSRTSSTKRFYNFA